MKKKFILTKIVIFISIIFVTSIYTTSCKTENAKLIDAYNKKNIEAAEEDNFITFERFSVDNKIKYHSFLIPDTWKSANEGAIFSGQETLTNNEKTKYSLISFTHIENLEKLGIKEFSDSKKVFSTTVNKLISYWEESGFILSNENKKSEKFILKNEKMSSYLLEGEEIFDLGAFFPNILGQDEKQSNLFYILFIVYEDKYIGYYVLLDSYFDRGDDLNILNNFVSSLEINEIYSK